MLAINRLNKFYAPKLHKVASKAELRTDDRIYVVGGENTIAAPTGNTRTNVARVQLLEVVLAAKPFTLGSLVADLAKKSPEAKVEEAHSQRDYEVFLASLSAIESKDWFW